MVVDQPIHFIGIGTFKSGTGTIHRFLEAHPEICFSIPKEIRWFNDTYYNFTTVENPNRNKTLEWYHGHWKHKKPGQLLGEFSPAYFADLNAAKKIHRYNPDIKLLVSFREPVARVHSHYLMNALMSKNEMLPFTLAIRENDTYLNNTRYYTHLKRYMDLFSDDQIHIVFVEDFRKDFQKEISRMFRFLGVDDSFFPEHFARNNNQAKMYKNPFWKAAKSIVSEFSRRGGAPVINWLRKHNIHLLFEKYTTKPIEKGIISDDDRQFIVSQLREEVLNLQELFNRDLSHWLTDNNQIKA